MTLRCGKDGKVLLYGTGCARCDCPGAVLELDGVTSREQAERIARRARGFDSGRDAGDAFAYMTAAFMAGAKRDRDAHMAAQQERVRRSTWRGTATMAPVEIITDPADQRGLMARPARVPQ